jgi:hypothetical protein
MLLLLLLHVSAAPGLTVGLQPLSHSHNHAHSHSHSHVRPSPQRPQEFEDSLCAICGDEMPGAPYWNIAVRVWVVPKILGSY